MKKILLFMILIVFSLIGSACGSSVSQASPEGVVKLAIQARANGDEKRFKSLIIEGKDFLWKKIINCDGKGLPDFTYKVEKTQYWGQSLTVVYIYKGNRENGGFTVTKLENKWYLDDWVGEISCK